MKGYCIITHTANGITMLADRAKTQIGNGWTVDVIANILSYIPAAELARRPPLPFRHFNPATQQLTLL